MWNYKGSRYLLVGSAVQTSKHQSHRYVNLPTGRIYLFKMDSSPKGNQYIDPIHEASQSSQIDNSSIARPFSTLTCHLISICRMDRLVFVLKPLDEERIIVGSGRKLCLMTLNEQFHFHLLTETITRFPVLSIDTIGYQIAVADQKDGILFYTYQPEENRIVPLRVDGTIRLSSDNLFVNRQFCVATDKAGSLFAVACNESSIEEDELVESAPEIMNFHLGEVALRLRCGSLVYSTNSHMNTSKVDPSPATPISFIAMTLLGSVIVFREIVEKEYRLAHLLQCVMCDDTSLKLQLVGWHLSEYRYQYFSPEAVIDGDFLTQFLTLSTNTQESIVERLKLRYLEEVEEGCRTKESISIESLCYFISTLNQQCI